MKHHFDKKHVLLLLGILNFLIACFYVTRHFITMVKDGTMEQIGQDYGERKTELQVNIL